MKRMLIAAAVAGIMAIVAPTISSATEAQAPTHPTVVIAAAEPPNDPWDH